MEELFSSTGPLVTRFGLTERKGQKEMLYLITNALSQNKGCLIEAPTGSGKSLSYLFPAAEFVSSLQSKGLKPRVIISTASKGLQDQLVKKDFPLLTQIYPNITCKVLKGANNYICLNRLRKLTQSTKKQTNQEAIKLYSHITELRKLPTGSKDEVKEFGCSDELWADICGASPCCGTDNHDKCFKKYAYAEARDANILCVNHTFLSFLALFTQTIHPAKPKPEETLIIVDEGHELIPQLRSAINKNFSLYVLRQYINGLQDATRQQKLLHTLETIVDSLVYLVPVEGLPVKDPNSQAAFEMLRLAKLMFELGNSMAVEYQSLDQAGFFLDEHDKREAVILFNSVLSQATFLQKFISTFPKDTMFEIIKNDSAKSKFSKIKIQYRPFNYDEELKHIYTHSAYPPIITSATLLNTDPARVLKEFCLDPNIVEVKQITSEFDYLTSIKGFVFPDINNMDPETLIYWLKYIIPLSHGNALILFTNRKVMQTTYQGLLQWSTTLGYQFLMQEEGTPASTLSAIMKDNTNCVLFGLRAMWTGIDIKGKNLSSVIITKLPFDPPDNFSEAYGVYLQKHGLHPFYNWSLPEMINRFRQGIGRLKRDEKDKGLIFILDPRFVSSTYKTYVLGKLPLFEWNQIRDPKDLPQVDQWLGVSPPVLQEVPKPESQYEDPF